MQSLRRLNVKKQVDLQLVRIKERVWIVPQTTTGMLWLQLHFAEDEWPALSSDALVLPRHDAALLAIDAEDGGLIVSTH